MLILQLVFLLIVANGVPVLASRLLGHRFERPLDGGLRLYDGQPLFGKSKTVRGIILSVVVTAVTAALIGLGWKAGMVIGAAAMLGDLLASLIKRRLAMPPSSQAPGLDQIPESLLPMLACMELLSLTLFEITAVVVIFVVLVVVLSKILYRMNIRKRPY